MQKIVGAFLRIRFPYVDILYVGRARAEGTVHMVNFRRGTCWSPGTIGVKNVKQCSMTTKLRQKNH